MKTKNLTPWCNLYLSESKYKLSLTASRYPKLVYASVVYFTLAVTLFLIDSNVHQISVLSFVFIFYLGYFLSVKTDNKLSKKTKKFIFIDHDLSIEFYQAIDKEGEIVRVSDTLSGTLSAGSRVGVMGFWLNITSETEGRPIIYNKFIFKDCLSTQDYARLSRITRLVK